MNYLLRMKFVILSILLAFSLAVNEDVFFGQLIKGFLTGIQETGDFSKLKDCIKEGDKIIANIKEACELISTIKSTEVTKGLKVLITGLQSLFEMLKPCTQGFTQLLRLVNEVAKADIQRLVRKVLASPGSYFHLAMNVLEALDDKKPEIAGKSLGIMVKNLFLTSRADVPMVDFLKGYLESVGEKGDIKELMNCIKENKAIFDNLRKACELIQRTLDVEDVIEGTKIFVAVNKDIMIMLKACLSKFEVLKRIDASLAKADIAKLVKYILAHDGSFFHLCINYIEAMDNNQPQKAGVAIGTMIKLLFLVSRTEGHFVEFIEGFLEGINEHGDIHKLLECLKEAEVIFDKILAAVEKILKMDIENIVEGIHMLIAAIKELVKVLEPCSEGFEQLKKLIDAAVKADILKIVLKIIQNPEPFIHDILDMYEMLSKGQYKQAGFDLGDLLSLIFLID